ncbi:MAG: transposase family protein [Trichodesmium sp. MAG_R01]|nr:transposase family protein [Trichodesmium sp. MAG_R01]
MNCWKLFVSSLTGKLPSQKPRLRARGVGRKARWPEAKDQLFFIWFYFKCYPTFDVAGVLFDLDRSRAHRWMLRLQVIPFKVGTKNGLTRT